MRQLILLAAISLLVAPSAHASACAAVNASPDAKLTAKVDAIVDGAAAKGFAGGVAIIRDGVLVYSRTAGYSDAQKKVPVGPETLFHVASITKYLTATLVLKAAEEGRLSLDQPLSVHLPGAAIAARGTRIADLLAHRSGLGSSYAAESQANADDAIDAIDAAGVDESKIGAFRYSNDGYDLLAIILERAYGEPYEKVARRLLGSACVEDASFWGEADLDNPARVGQPLRALPPELKGRNYGMIGSAGFLATALDLARLQSAIADGDILAQSSIDQLFAPQGEVSIGQATYGAFLQERPALGTMLSARGYEDWGDNAILNHYLEQNVVVAVVTSKGPPEGAPPFRDEISKEIESILAEPR